MLCLNDRLASSKSSDQCGFRCSPRRNPLTFSKHDRSVSSRQGAEAGELGVGSIFIGSGRVAHNAPSDEFCNTLGRPTIYRVEGNILQKKNSDEDKLKSVE
jgi:hypothetical protein